VLRIPDVNNDTMIPEAMPPAVSIENDFPEVYLLFRRDYIFLISNPFILLSARAGVRLLQRCHQAEKIPANPKQRCTLFARALCGYVV